jgi:hypothetical protein
MVTGYWNSQSEPGIREKWIRPRWVNGNSMPRKGQLVWNKEGSTPVPASCRSAWIFFPYVCVMWYIPKMVYVNPGIEASLSSRMLLSTYQTTQCHIPQHCTYLPNNLKLWTVWTSNLIFLQVQVTKNNVFWSQETISLVRRYFIFLLNGFNPRFILTYTSKLMYTVSCISTVFAFISFNHIHRDGQPSEHSFDTYKSNIRNACC